MNPHRQHTTSLAGLAESLWAHRGLIGRMTRHDVIGRYRGSFLGLGWSFVTPMLMLAIYTFVFSFVFQARWDAERAGNRADFAVILFAGLVVHGLLAEILARAPIIVEANQNYVKRVVFPLEILPVPVLLGAVFHTLISLGVLILALLLLKGAVPATALLAPLVFLPFLLVALAAAWFLAALGVFVRDIRQTVGLLTTVLLFMSPVFYPLSILPPVLQKALMLNPLTLIIEEARAVLIFGEMPDWGGLAVYSAVGFAAAWAGFAWFQRMRRHFADVL